MTTDELDKTQRLHQLIRKWASGDRQVLADLTPMMYRELQQLVTHFMRHERRDRKLGAAALVEEAFRRIGHNSLSFSDDGHFYGIAAKLIRTVLVDHAKSHDRLRDANDNFELIRIDEAISTLAKTNQLAAQVLELHYFGLMSVEQTAAVLGIKIPLVGSEIRFANAWLKMRLRKA